MLERTKELKDTLSVLHKVLRRVGFRGSKSEISEQINTFSNIRDKEYYFREIFSALGYVLQPISNEQFGEAIASQNLFITKENNAPIGFKYNNKGQIELKSDDKQNIKTSDIKSLKGLNLNYYKIIKISEDIKETKNRITKLNPILTLGSTRLFFVIIASLFSNILALASAIFIMVVYDKVIPNNAVESLYSLAIGVAIAILFDSLLRGAKSGLINRATEGSDLIVNEEIYNQFVELSGTENDKSVGELSSVVRDLETYRDFMSTATLSALIDLPFILIFIYVISLISGPLYIVPLIAVPVVLFGVLLAQPIITKVSRTASKTAQSRQSVLMDILGGLAPLRASGAFAIMKRKFMQSTSDNMMAVNRSKNVGGFNAGFMQAVQQISQVAIIVYGFHLYSEQLISMGAIIATVILSGKAMAPLAKLGQMLSRLGAALVARRNIIDFLSLPRKKMVAINDAFHNRNDLEIEISNVTVRLDKGATPLFSNFTLSIKPGEKVAIIGPTGAGKSTLANVLCGLVLPEIGNVQIKGNDVRTINRAEFHRNIGVVFQEPWLFLGSLRENISMGYDEVTDDEIVRALTLSGVHVSDEMTSETLDRVILSQGKNLSGGQKQSIALSRAVLFQQEILILDEPTSAMDQMMESRLINGFNEYLKDKTLILITHKPNMLQLCDRVVVIEKGQKRFDDSKERYIELVSQK